MKRTDALLISTTDQKIIEIDIKIYKGIKNVSFK